MIKKIILTLLITGTIIANDMTPPDTPQILGVSYDGKVVLTWNKVAEESIDAKTGYFAMSAPHAMLSTTHPDASRSFFHSLDH